jgi:hypothetical protein
MALKDMKSDLSKFRMPKSTPLESKERVNVNKNLNKTPLSSMVESAPKIQRSQTTTNKEGVNPQKVNQTEKFKGETTPSKMDNSEQFLGETTPTPSNKESKFLGETNPSKMDNSETFLGETTPKPANNSEQFLGETTPTKSNLQEKFLGETNPNKFDNSEKFLGETTPKSANNSEQFLGETDAKPMSLEERFLGETTPSKMNNSEQFLGETTPTPSNKESKFLGETNTKPMSLEERFLGETTPNESDRSSKFLGETTPTPANNESRFLGETTPNPSDISSKFLGETTPTESDRSSKFLGETTPNPSDRSSKFLGETTKANITQGDKDKGETTPNDFTFNPNHSDRGVTPTDINYIQDIHAAGFNSKFGGVDATKFIGVNPNNTVFDNTNSLYSNIDDGKFTLGKTYEQSFDSAGRLNSGETGFGIGKGQAQRQSPSFLDEMYSKYNLKEDSFNRGLGLFRQPFILRGIQRKKISKGEPQNWGLLGFNYDEGAIRGGIVTSTARALIDVARIGSWFASIPGILWGAKQFGMQRTNRFGKVWTPVGMLAAIGGQHIGLKPMRPGLVPLDDPTVKYGNVLNGYEVAENAGGPPAKKAAALLVGYDTLDLVYEKNLFGKDSDGNNAIWKSDIKGGFNSTYGINLSGPSNHTRYVNTFSNPSKDKSHTNPKTNFNQTYEPLNKDKWEAPKTPDKFNTYSDDLPQDSDESKNFGVATQISEFSGGGINSVDANGNTNGDVPGAEVIKDYQTIAYGDIPDRVAGDTTFNDFRSKLSGQELERAEKENYSKKNINTRVNFGNPGKLGESENRYEWYNTDKVGDRYDKINALDLDESGIDLVNMWFQAEGGQKVQFRGTAKGITETFSPSWDSVKYNGRADQAYKYTTFERSVSFNFQAYATSRIEMKPMWKKLQYLSTMTMPQYGGGDGYQGTLITFRLGSLYNGKLAFIENLSYTMSDETPWEISMLASENQLGELPMGVDISIGLKILGGVRPAEGVTGIYDWNSAHFA